MKFCRRGVRIATASVITGFEIPERLLIILSVIQRPVLSLDLVIRFLLNKREDMSRVLRLYSL